MKLKLCSRLFNIQIHIDSSSCILLNLPIEASHKRGTLKVEGPYLGCRVSFPPPTTCKCVQNYLILPWPHSPNRFKWLSVIQKSWWWGMEWLRVVLYCKLTYFSSCYHQIVILFQRFLSVNTRCSCSVGSVSKSTRPQSVIKYSSIYYTKIESVLVRGREFPLSDIL